MNVLLSKKFQLAVVVLLCAAILAGGSFAWFSLNQNALNEFSWNPEGANLHDDFTDPNKDVYVENTGTLPLLVRVQLREFMQFGSTTIPAAGATRGDKASWPAHSGKSAGGGADCANDFHKYWTWTMGGEKWYVPASQTEIDAIRGYNEDGTSDSGYNSRSPVVNNPIDQDGLPKALKDRYAGYAALTQAIANDTVMQGHLTTLSEEKTALAAAIEAYSQAPTDTAKAEALKAARDEHYTAQTAANKYALETFGVQQSRPAQIKLMSEWVNEGKALGDFWVIDTNGWCYWASPLEAGEATGLLLDKVEATNEIAKLKSQRQAYYYGIDVTMQAATADDVEKYWNETYTGASQAASASAQELLNKIAAACASGDGTAAADVPDTFSLRAAAVQPADSDEPGEGGQTSASGGPVHEGKYWTRDGEGGVWRYNDGRWTYDGEKWRLYNRDYPFGQYGWTISGNTGKADYVDDYYVDEYWYYIGETWNPTAGNFNAIHPDDAPGEETPPDSAAPPAEESGL